MKCITSIEGCAILQDNHAGIYDSHMGARSLVDKANRQGFFWPHCVVLCRLHSPSVSVFRLLETCAISSTVDHTYYLAFLYIRAKFGRSVQES
jgi:hypothetical protein